MEPLKRGAPERRPARVAHLTPERFLDAAAKRFLRERPDRCAKCGSTFMRHEPAFVHCRLCGKIARLANASLADQELFEIRSGLRLAC
jgi:ribosomal protein S27AE